MFRQRWGLVLKLAGILPFILISFNVKSQSSQLAVTHHSFEKLSPLKEPVTNCAVTSIYKNGEEYLYVFGGIDSTLKYSGIHRRCYRIKVSNQSEIKRLPDLPDTLGKIAASASRIGTKAYIVGGYHVFADGSEASSKLVHEFDLIGDTFTHKKIVLPLATDDHIQGVWRDSLLYVISGWSNTGNLKLVQIYDPKKDQWTNGTPFASDMIPVFGASGGILRDQIFIYGGARSDQQFFPSVSKLYIGTITPDTPQQISWETEQTPDSLTSYRAAFFTGVHELYWIGGSKSSYNYDGKAYDTQQQLSPNPTIMFSLGSGSGVRTTEVDKKDQLFFDIIKDEVDTFPMDIRDFTSIQKVENLHGAYENTTNFYLAGGILNNGRVSNEIIRIQQRLFVGTEEINNVPIRVYPNPVTDILSIHWDAFKEEELAIYNTLGTVVVPPFTIKGQTTINLTSLPKGTYILTNKAHSWHRKIIKK